MRQKPLLLITLPLLALTAVLADTPPAVPSIPELEAKIRSTVSTSDAARASEDSIAGLSQLKVDLINALEADIKQLQSDKTTASLSNAAQRVLDSEINKQKAEKAALMRSLGKWNSGLPGDTVANGPNIPQASNAGQSGGDDPATQVMGNSLTTHTDQQDQHSPSQCNQPGGCQQQNAKKTKKNAKTTNIASAAKDPKTPQDPKPTEPEDPNFKVNEFLQGLVGGTVAGASGTDPRATFAGSFRFDLPLVHTKDKPNIYAPWSISASASIGSMQSPNNLSALISPTSDTFTSVLNQSPEKIVQSFEMGAGLAYKVGHPFRAGTRGVVTLNLIGGGGMITPLSPSQTVPPTFIATNEVQTYYSGLPANSGLNLTSQFNTAACKTVDQSNPKWSLFTVSDYLNLKPA